MYETRFGFRRRPFPATPDSTCYYPATSHERALTQLQRALADGEGMALLTATPGTGKTLVCHSLLERLGPGVSSAYVTNSHLAGRADLLQALLYDLGLPHEGSEQGLRLRLTDYLLKNYQAARAACASVPDCEPAAGWHARRAQAAQLASGAVVIVDEAQHLTADLLEELRLLGNLEAGSGKAVQVILAGQPELLQTLSRPELAALSQRTLLRTRLEPLGVEEAVDYLRHHLRAAGGRPERIMPEETLDVLARRTGGVPRLLNQAAHQALALADSADSPVVDVEAALEALALLGLEGEAVVAEAQASEGRVEGGGCRGEGADSRSPPTP
ncbi:MAG: AAA family ATPase, partial [Gemmataceae bacterium]|nr:AAA family ATPase [Gemmataceae bacterium]